MSWSCYQSMLHSVIRSYRLLVNPSINQQRTIDLLCGGSVVSMSMRSRSRSPIPAVRRPLPRPLGFMPSENHPSSAPASCVRRQLPRPSHLTGSASDIATSPAASSSQLPTRNGPTRLPFDTVEFASCSSATSCATFTAPAPLSSVSADEVELVAPLLGNVAISTTACVGTELALLGHGDVPDHVVSPDRATSTSSSAFPAPCYPDYRMLCMWHFLPTFPPHPFQFQWMLSWSAGCRPTSLPF